MGVNFRPIGLPGNNYSQDEESQFRRNLETYLLEISSAVNSSESANEGAASPASKRESLLLRPYSENFPLSPGLRFGPGITAVVDTTAKSIHYTGHRLVKLQPSVTTDLEYIIGGDDGDVITLMAFSDDTDVTLKESGTGSNRIKLTTSTVVIDDAYDNVTLIKSGVVWVEIARALH
tara:strand:+ start:107 stop:637 length:531 start_codon:yes stop_codon:yes gene_type:complete